MNHRETTLGLATELPLVIVNENKDSLSIVTTITNRVEIDDEVTTKRPVPESVNLQPVSNEKKRGDQVEVVTLKVDDAIASGAIEVITPTESSDLSLEDNFLTTKTWIPDTSLSAEHKESTDQNIKLETVTQPPESLLTTVAESMIIKSDNNRTSDELIISNSSPTPFPSPTSEMVEEVSLTTSSDNMVIM